MVIDSLWTKIWLYDAANKQGGQSPVVAFHSFAYASIGHPFHTVWHLNNALTDLIKCCLKLLGPRRCSKLYMTKAVKSFTPFQPLSKQQLAALNGIEIR